MGAHEGRRQRDGLHGAKPTDGSQHAKLGLDVEPVSALHLRGRRATGEHRVEPRQAAGDEVRFRRRAGSGHSLHDASAPGRDLGIAGAGEPVLELVAAIAGKYEVRVRIDETGHDDMPSAVDDEGVAREGNRVLNVGRRADRHDFASMGGDRRAVERTGVALHRPAPWRRPATGIHAVGVLDEEVSVHERGRAGEARVSSPGPRSL